MFSMHICINKLLSDTLNRRVHVFKLPHCFRIQSCGQFIQLPLLWWWHWLHAMLRFKNKRSLWC